MAQKASGDTRVKQPFHEKLSYTVAIIGIFSAILGLLAILAWIVPFGHITMEFLINVVIIVLLKMKKKRGTLFFTGIITGLIDMMAGLAGPGGFLAPAVYALRFGFLELVVSLFQAKATRAKNWITVLANAGGYFLTATFIWTMYTVLFIPLGNETVQQMWFVFAAIGTVVSMPATLLGILIFNKFIGPALKHTQFLEDTGQIG